MNTKQIASIVEEVRVLYPYLAKESSVEAMYKAYKKHLANEDYERVMKNLENHVKKSKFPPSIHDLVVDDMKHWGTPVVIEEVPEKTPEELAEIKRIIAEGKANLMKILNKQGGE